MCSFHKRVSCTFITSYLPLPNVASNDVSESAGIAYPNCDDCILGFSLTRHATSGALSLMGAMLLVHQIPQRGYLALCTGAFDSAPPP